MAKAGKKMAAHAVARVSGVKETDTKIEGALKAIATMRAAGFPAASIRKAERMLEDYKARTGETK